jgi:hypothetical protein
MVIFHELAYGSFMKSTSSDQLRVLRGINFIRVRGTLAERARAHAALLKERIPLGPIPVLVKKNEWMLRRGPGLLERPWVQSMVVAFYKRFLVPMMEQGISSEVREVITVMAQEIGITYEEMRECVLQPDAMMLLARSSLMKHVLPEWMPGGLPGCTSAVAFGSWTKTGQLLACRNFDYFIVGAWERQPTVIFNEPTEPHEIPYYALTSAGVQAGGLTAMNQEGLTLFTHAHFGKVVSMRGNPIVAIGDEVIRTAKTIGQAVDMAKKRRSYANWAFVMSSAREGDAAVIEVTPDRVKVHRVEDDLLVHTNYFHSPELRQNEALMSGAYCEDLKARFCRIKQLLAPHQGVLEPHHMSAALGDHVDYVTGQERVFGNTLSVVTTIKSAVFDPENLRFWMGSRQESPLGLGDYVEVKVEEFWKKSSEEYEQEMSVLPGYRPQADGLVQAVHYYREAYQAYHMQNDAPDYQEKALGYLGQAALAYPQDGHLWIQKGLVAFKLHRFKEAREALERTLVSSGGDPLSSVLSAHVSQVRDLYLARCLDCLGEREKAIYIYKTSLISSQEPKLKKAFKQGIRSPYVSKNSSQMVIDLQFPDTFAY